MYSTSGSRNSPRRSIRKLRCSGRLWLVACRNGSSAAMQPGPLCAAAGRTRHCPGDFRRSSFVNVGTRPGPCHSLGLGREARRGPPGIPTCRAAWSRRHRAGRSPAPRILAALLTIHRQRWDGEKRLVDERADFLAANGRHLLFAGFAASHVGIGDSGFNKAE